MRKTGMMLAPRRRERQIKTCYRKGRHDKLRRLWQEMRAFITSRIAIAQFCLRALQKK